MIRLIERFIFLQSSSLKCMNDVFLRTGEFKHLTTPQGDNVPCLAACEDQTQQFLLSSSVYPNRQTLVSRPEFCLVVARLRKSCSGPKLEVLAKKYPQLCPRIASQPNLCQSGWSNRRKKGLVSVGGDIERLLSLFC